MALKQTQTSGLAIASLVLGILSLIIGWIPVIGWFVIFLALLFGIISLVNIRSNKQLSGKGLAIAGIILSSITLILYVLFFVGLIFAGQIGTFGESTRECPGKCVMGADMEVGNNCNVNFESKLSGVWIAKGTPKGKETENICKECCIPTG